ncbi:hypothetical protein APHAL10511_007709 [Amanita phalloides]|nr:hypothetical protein APHAL10511_007709 [Amanita phalloides]
MKDISMFYLHKQLGCFELVAVHRLVAHLHRCGTTATNHPRPRNQAAHGFSSSARGFAPPPGPPPQSGSSGYGYAPPSGPPPNHYAPPNAPPRSGYPGQEYHQANYPGQPSYAPPTGPPPTPPTHDQAYGPVMQGGNQPFFRYSQCNGRKKALLIGINYFGQDGQLGGCINDAMNMQNFLCRHFGYKTDDIVLLRDDASNPAELPTRDNMLRAMQWLVKDARPNDSLFFHYSGHGGQTKDLDGDEDDGFDEVVYPMDFKTKSHIVDDLLHDILVKPLPPGCRLTAIFDSCHSGSALDLPYIYSTEGKIKEPNLMAEAGQGLMTTVTSYARGDVMGAVMGAFNLAKVASGRTRAQEAGRVSRTTKTSPADAISWSGCKDSQTSADTQEAGKATGAMSFAFISALERNPHQSYQELLVNIRTILRDKYEQKPQLSCSHPMDTNLLFIC